MRGLSWPPTEIRIPGRIRSMPISWAAWAPRTATGSPAVAAVRELPGGRVGQAIAGEGGGGGGAGRGRLRRQAVRLPRADRAHPRPGAARTRLARGRAAG